MTDEKLPDPPGAGTMTYGSYLKVNELLSLQTLRSNPPEHDEMLFIVIHQVYELWFKLLIHEGEKVKRNLCSADLYGALGTLRRCRNVLKVLVSQLDVLETMTPMEFASFRSFLEKASGFQSAQFRAFECMLGFKRPEFLKFYAEDSAGYDCLKHHLDAPSLVDALYTFLEKNGVEIPDELKDAESIEARAEVTMQFRETLVWLYREKPEMTLLLEALTDIDEGLQEWRYRHVKMVERTIGTKQGTGGSSGAEYLKRTLFRPVFPDLWAIRNAI